MKGVQRGDEFSKQGKSQLNQLLIQPYFKVSTADYCDFYDEEKCLHIVFEDELINSDKQKWTGKDIKELCDTIKHVIIDAEVKKYQDRYFYLMTRLEFEKSRQQKLNNVKKSQEKNSTTKSKSIQSDKNPSITIPQHLFSIDSGKSSGRINVTAQVSMKENELKTWLLQNESRLRKLTYESLMNESQYVDAIDWFKVAKNMTTDTGKDRTANDCFLAWKHEAHSSVNTKRWNSVETKKLMDFVKKINQTKKVLDWDELAIKLGNNRTSYQYFHKYRNQLVQAEMMNWNEEEKTEKLNHLLRNEGSNWKNVVEFIGDVRGTKHQMQERWKKTSNPILRHGPFTRVEDALLLLQIQKLQEFIKKERNFVILISYLPWRFETVWRDRASHLFSNTIIPWTKEEDEKLIKLADAQTGRKDWQTISKEFSSCKNRKGCLTRYKILKRRIGTESGKSFRNIEEYHESYSMFRYNVFQYKHLTEVLELLNRVLNEKLCEQPFPGLSCDHPPEEWELRWMLLDFDRYIVQQTINRLTGFIQSKNASLKIAGDESGKLNKTFDRRSFHRDNPKSVASALHMRDTIKLIPKDQIGRPLTPFENDVYTHYARFCRTKPLKKDAPRPYIPTAEELRSMTEVSEIIVNQEKIYNLHNSSIKHGKFVTQNTQHKKVLSTELNGSRKKRSQPPKIMQETDSLVQSKKQDQKIVSEEEDKELVLTTQMKVKEEMKNEKRNKRKLGKVQEMKNLGSTSPLSTSSSTVNHEQVTEVENNKPKDKKEEDTITVSRRKRQQMKSPSKSCELSVVRKSPRISRQ